MIDIEAWRLPFVAIGVGYLALAAWLLALDFPSRLNRAFALYLFLDGAREFAQLFDWSTPDGLALRSVSVHMAIAAPLALLYFMLTYEERFGSHAWRRRALLPLLAIQVVLSAAVLRDPALYFSGFSVGPIGHLSSWLRVLTPCVAAYLFGREATRHAEPARRHALLLASLAFAMGPLFSALHLLVPNFMGSTASEQVVQLLALLPIGFLAAHMARVARSEDAPLRGEARRFLAALSLPAASVLVFAGSMFASHPVRLWVMSTIMSVWMLALPFLVIYALVRHRLFDVEVKIRWGISRGSIAAVFVAVFFVASEGAQEFFGDTMGSTYLGIAAAGALVFAIAPLQRVAERLAERAVPVAGAATTATAEDRRLSAYRRAYALAWADGQCSAKEMRMLVALRDELALTPAEIQDIERQLQRDGHAAGGDTA